MSILYSSLAVVAGFVVLVWSADRFVLGASSIARNLGVSPMIVGLTVVGFGTSAPEMFVSAVAALDGSSDIGIGNAIGSNIANIGLILGITALVTPLVVRSETLRREFPILLAITLIVMMLLYDQSLDRVDGVIFLGGLLVVLYWMISLGARSRITDPMPAEFAAEMPRAMRTSVAVGWFVVGLVGLLVSSRILVLGAVNIAEALGVSQLVIGLTIVAVGTSLPELAASVASALKNEHDIAIGNVLGSNMYNLLAVLAMPAIIAPGPLAPEVMSRDYLVMTGMTVALFALAYGFRGAGRLNRFEGAGLLMAFLVYQVIVAAQ